MRTPLLLATPVALLLLLTACTAEVPPAPEETYATDPSATETPEPLVPNEIEEDTTLIVRATATAANGAALSLDLQIHQAVPFDDIAAQTLPAAVLADCAGVLTTEQFTAESWGFTRANLTAIPADSSAAWPSDARVEVVPSAAAAYTAGRGILVVEGSPLCTTSKSISTEGRGALSIGIPGDATSHTGWAGQRFGFASTDGVTLTDCSIEVTALGASLGGGIDWVDASTPVSCSTGAAVETQRY